MSDRAEPMVGSHPRDSDPSVAGTAGSSGDVAEELATELRDLLPTLPDRIDADPESLDRELGRLVLTVVELLRQVLEHQAVRRMEGGSLTEEEEERLGLALLRLRERMADLTDSFGLEPDDLNIELGPLGRLL